MELQLSLSEYLEIAKSMIIGFHNNARIIGNTVLVFLEISKTNEYVIAGTYV